MDLNMLVLLDGQERAEEQFERLFKAAGFRLERTILTRSPFSAIEGTGLSRGPAMALHNG